MRPAVLLAYAAACLGMAPLHPAPAGAEVPNNYLVVFNKDASQEAIEKHLASVQSKRVFNINNDFRGYSAVFDDAGLQAVRNDAAVAYVNADQVVHALGACEKQANAEWNLDRTSSRSAKDMSGSYFYDKDDGKGVDVYVIDTGIRITHDEFEDKKDKKSRAKFGVNTVRDGNDSDCNGHGTHVASSVAGNLYGVAKEATVIAVKVLGCGGSGTYEGVIEGIEWTANAHQKSGEKVSVLNMSLGGGYFQAVNDATDAAVRAGVVAVIASGNSNADACNFSPASSPLAIAVNSAELGAGTDGRSSFSNFGQCTKIFAPGSSVKGAWHTSDTATNTISGTSMASPHVAGVAAQYISRDKNDNDTPAKVLETLRNFAGKDQVIMRCTSGACEQTPNLYANSFC